MSSDVPVVLGRTHRSKRRAVAVGVYTFALASSAVILAGVALGQGRPGSVWLLSVPLGAVAFWFPYRVVRAHVRFDFDGRYLRVHDGVRRHGYATSDILEIQDGDPIPSVVVAGETAELAALRRFSLGPLDNHVEVDGRLALLRVELEEARHRLRSR